jgi:transposase
MNKVSRGRGSKYTDCFKRKLVSESRADGMSASMLAKKHGVGSNWI